MGNLASVAHSPGLAALVAPVPIRQFLQEFWPERIFHAHGSLSRLPALFRSPALSSFRALTQRYQGWLGFGRGQQGSRMISVQQVSPAHLYEMGLSVYLPDIVPSVQGAEDFLRQLESELGLAAGCARMTVWASPKGDGAPTHFDGEDVFSIQLAGSKRFEVAPMTEYAYPVGAQFAPGAAPYDEMYAQIRDGFPDAAGVEFESVEMKPGSVLFVPRGTWHRTVAEQDSFAISIGLNPPSIAETFLDQLRYVLLQDPQWRRPVYGASRGRELDETLNEVLESAPRALRAISARDLLPLGEMQRLANIDSATRFQRDPGTRMLFSDERESHKVEILVAAPGGEQATLTMNVPREYSAVFRWLAEARAAFSAGELRTRFPGVPFEQLSKILDVLTRAKYLRLLWFPRLPDA
jgi:quercetin dioxygenase-like cupin family protein